MLRLIEYGLRLNGLVYGTADCVLVNDQRLWIVDLKTGQGIKVFAKNNAQLMIYAVMALREFGLLYDFDVVVLVIAQPPLDHYDSWEISREDLLAFEKDLLAAAERTQDKNAPLIPSDKACQFCRAKYDCKARAHQALELARQDFALLAPNQLTIEQIAKVLTHKAELRSWLDDAEAHAMQLVGQGLEIPGFKLVEGRASRRFTDPEAVAQRLTGRGIDPYEKSLMSLTAIEKLLGKKEFAELLGDSITKQPGRSVLVPDTDERPSLRSAASIAADFHLTA
jgi:hypothetical protein